MTRKMKPLTAIATLALGVALGPKSRCDNNFYPGQ